MTHEEYQAILKFSDEIIPQLKILAEKSMMDRVGVYLAISVLQANFLRIQTEDLIAQMKAQLNPEADEAEKIANKGGGDGK